MQKYIYIYVNFKKHIVCVCLSLQKLVHPAEFLNAHFLMLRPDVSITVCNVHLQSAGLFIHRWQRRSELIANNASETSCRSCHHVSAMTKFALLGLHLFGLFYFFAFKNMLKESGVIT